MASRTFVVGDIHGAHIALQQCLTRCGFDQITDRLITLGDICDGWPYVYECVEILLTIDSINLAGNHDEWFKTWLKTGTHPVHWSQGGKGTAQSYLKHIGKDANETAIFWLKNESGRDVTCYTFDFNFADVPPAHVNFFNSQHLYYEDDKNRLFVHGGFNRIFTLKDNQRENPSDFYWNRRLWLEACNAGGKKLKFVEPFTEIFIGHSATVRWTTKEFTTDAGIIIPLGEPLTEPMFRDIIVNVDTGAGMIGKLTIMDVDTHEYWQSDPVEEIYGDYKPR